MRKLQSPHDGGTSQSQQQRLIGRARTDGHAGRGRHARQLINGYATRGLTTPPVSSLLLLPSSTFSFAFPLLFPPLRSRGSCGHSLEAPPHIAFFHRVFDWFLGPWNSVFLGLRESCFPHPFLYLFAIFSSSTIQSLAPPAVIFGSFFAHFRDDPAASSVVVGSKPRRRARRDDKSWFPNPNGRLPVLSLTKVPHRPALARRFLLPLPACFLFLLLKLRRFHPFSAFALAVALCPFDRSH